MELDDLTEELSADEDEADNSLDDANDLEEEEYGKTAAELINDYIDMRQFKAYLPCCAHNIQLVLKDGFKLDKTYEDLLKKVSMIVSKSKQSSIIAELLRDLDKFLHKNILTRWNSILFLIRSILKLSPTEFTQIRNSLPTNTTKQKATKKMFKLEKDEREMLAELRDLLGSFEFVTNEFQTNEISISRVYPCILFLKRILSETHSVTTKEPFKYTKSIRQVLLKSLETRFDELIKNNDIFMLSTLLDPNFGRAKIPKIEREFAILKLKSHLVASSTRSSATVEKNKKQNNLSEKDIERDNNYKTFDDESDDESPLNELDNQINEYFRLIETNKYTDALLFWKTHHQMPSFINLAKLAQKVLGVPATSAEVERMFSISGHILNNKRRTTGINLYENLVFLKLNEKFLNCKCEMYCECMNVKAKIIENNE